MIRSVPKGRLASYKRLTQLIRGRRPVGRQDEPNPAMLSFTWNVEARRSLPTISSK
jgi:hypothetical protein